MKTALAASFVLLLAVTAVAQRGRGGAPPEPGTPTPPGPPRVEQLKKEAAAEVEAMRVQTQQMVDQVFSFAELGFQEFETSKYLTDVLEKNGFEAERGYAGIPTAWFATWGSGKPVIAIGSDIDDIPQASQKPGVAYHDPIIAGAPGHGEGHNAGVPLNITAALAVKKIMERERLPGTLKLWPGVAEEHRPEMKKYYYDPAKYKTYLEQLGINYPTVRQQQRRKAGLDPPCGSDLLSAGRLKRSLRSNKLIGVGPKKRVQPRSSLSSATAQARALVMG
jgi:hypothetical protein